MKIGMFADPHYAHVGIIGKRKPLRSLGLVSDAMKLFKEERVVCAVCLGDIINDSPDGEDGCDTILSEITAPMRDAASAFPCFLVAGNHDRNAFSAARLEKLCALPIAPLYADFGSLRLIMLDGNFRSDGNQYIPGEVDWKDCMIPDEQMLWLKDTLSGASGAAAVFVHQCLAPDSEPRHRLLNAASVRELLEKSGKVREVFCGHYHPGQTSIHNNITYRCLPAMCEEGGAYIFDIN